MEEIKIRELPDKSHVEIADYIPIESIDGTKKVLVKHFRSMVLTSLYFDSINDLKTSSEVALREGDVVETLGYNVPGDSGAAKYRITYNPAAVEDGKTIHYLAYSDTLRAELIPSETINVHQFGAVGDGKTDDTVAIQAAIDYADSKVIEFNNNYTYVVRGTLNINKPNTFINGNGAILSPYYVDGINISSKEDEPQVSDVIINNLNFDCSKAVNAITMYQANKVDINECNIDKISSKGISIKNSTFINMEKCNFNSTNTGSSIILEGVDDGSVYEKCCRFININNCKFNGFSKAVYILSSGYMDDIHNITVNLTNCDYSSPINSNCVYIAAPVELVNVRSNTTDRCTTFLYFGGSSKGNVSCADISCLATDHVFDIGASQGVLTLEGSIKTNANMFKNMMGKLHSNIVWDLLPTGASFVNPAIGELFDAVYPTQYSDTKGYTIYQSKLTLNEVRNIHVDWSSSTNNLMEIVNGVKGQLLYIKSSTHKSIVSDTNKIILSRQSTSLSPYSGILLRYDGLKWVQVQDVPQVQQRFSAIDNVGAAVTTYDVWKGLGNEGGPQEFINDLKGQDGENGVGIANVSATASEDGKILTFTFLLDNGESKSASVELPTSSASSYPDNNDVEY